MPRKASPECIVYTGRQAKKSGLHTPVEFLKVISKDSMTQAMCSIASSAKQTVRVSAKDTTGNRHSIIVLKCPKDSDTKGWMKWAGADPCNASQAAKLKASKRGKGYKK